MNEKEMDDPIKETKPNPSRATTQELKNIPIGSANSQSVTKEILKRSPQVMLRIASTERDKHAQFVSINGVAYNIPRDTWVKVPREVVTTLEEAMITEYEVKADPTKSENATVSSSEVARFSMQTKPVEEPAKPEPTPAAVKGK